MLTAGIDGFFLDGDIDVQKVLIKVCLDFWTLTVDQQHGTGQVFEKFAPVTLKNYMSALKLGESGLRQGKTIKKLSTEWAENFYATCLQKGSFKRSKCELDIYRTAASSRLDPERMDIKSEYGKRKMRDLMINKNKIDYDKIKTDIRKQILLHGVTKYAAQ